MVKGSTLGPSSPPLPSRHRLSDLPQHLGEPGEGLVEDLPPLDPLELDGADRRAVPLLVLSHATARPLQGAPNPDLGAVPDELPVEAVARGRPREVPALLHEGLLGPDEAREALAEVHARVDLGEGDVAEGVAGDLLPGRLHLGDDLLDARPLAEEDVDAAGLVHDLPQSLALGGDAEVKLGDPDGVDVAGLGRGREARGRREGRLLAQLAVLPGRGRGEVPGVPSHDLVDDEHARVGGGLAHDVFIVRGSASSLFFVSFTVSRWNV
ncbi:hypothetical protein THAOC_16557 [Thalassiosira oceanica]|uniref:Uncharacterized protein n=1 Tax=Thalassiosira oceanica TaxID=159749 RepID=K0SPA5_THAOC|nr:hypothetical protein THAOC_16557 [Thalassiosira oceanica]|eukprot:EJK62816.1 hypothetical protein THAOC_16557 [Thalassiosira oceanica]